MEPVPETTAYEHIAYENLANSVLPCGYKVKFTRPNDARYEVLNGVMTGAGTTAKLIKSNCIDVFWELPTERENGDAFTPDETAGFQIDVNGVIHPIDKTATTVQIDKLSKGLKQLKIRTIDTDGVMSGWSDIVEVTI